MLDPAIVGKHYPLLVKTPVYQDDPRRPITKTPEEIYRDAQDIFRAVTDNDTSDVKLTKEDHQQEIPSLADAREQIYNYSLRVGDALMRWAELVNTDTGPLTLLAKSYALVGPTEGTGRLKEVFGDKAINWKEVNGDAGAVDYVQKWLAYHTYPTPLPVLRAVYRPQGDEYAEGVDHLSVERLGKWPFTQLERDDPHAALAKMGAKGEEIPDGEEGDVSGIEEEDELWDLPEPEVPEPEVPEVLPKVVQEPQIPQTTPTPLSVQGQRERQVIQETETRINSAINNRTSTVTIVSPAEMNIVSVVQSLRSIFGTGTGQMVYFGDVLVHL